MVSGEKVKLQGIYKINWEEVKSKCNTPTGVALNKSSAWREVDGSKRL